MHEKFEAWRPEQEESIRVTVTEQRRTSVMCAPTGFGKTASYVGSSLISGEPTCIVTANKGLADQLMADFESVGLVDIRGRANYDCAMREDYTCEDGHAARCPFKGSTSCPSSLAEMKASASSLVVTNYSKWIAARRYSQGMSHFTRVVFDEFHTAPDQLAAAMQVVLHHNEIEKVLGVDFLPHPDCDDFRNWRPWASETRAIAEEQMQEAQQRLLDTSDPKATWVKHYHHMRNLARRLATIATGAVNNWVVDEVEHGFQFDPINPARYAESTMLLRTPKIVAVSATIRPKTCYMTGMGKDTFTFTEYPSSFDPARCPFYFMETMKVDVNSGDLGQLWLRHDQIAARRKDRRGLGHTISYTRCQEMMNRSIHWERMITNEKGESISVALGKFAEAHPRTGPIFVSPSIGTGYDFPMDAAEWQFIVKVPFLDGRSKVIAARQHQDNEYGAYHAMQSLVQMAGRLMRKHEDQSETFLCDNNWTWFYRAFSHLAPNSFHKFHRTVTVMPQPPKPLELEA